uniref:C-type lectin domain-containing protein n=1 Tax=Echeneis naucrates TaxID=173247 RepID=A0A665UHL0_ECHNA
MTSQSLQSDTLKSWLQKDAPKVKIFFFQTLLSWKEAQDYCRTYFKDLAMIEDAEENTNVMSLLSNVQVWIGLYRNPWRWSDRNSNSSFRNWEAIEPNSEGQEHCVAENSQRYWADGDCHLRFIDYYHVDQPKTWTDAQKYCREKYTDLLSIESNDDLRLMNSVSVPTTWSWIGLHDDPKSWKGVMGKDENSWRWSATGETSENGFQNWAPTEPNNFGSNQHCVRISPEGEWIDRRCTERLQFVCYNEDPHREHEVSDLC